MQEFFFLIDNTRRLADLISLLDVNPHNEHPGIILESEFFDEADFALRYSNIQRRVVSARIGNVGMYLQR